MAKVSIKKESADIVRIFVPVSRDYVTQNSPALREAKRIAGGWTCRYVAGGWIDPAGNEVVEPVDEYEFIGSAYDIGGVLDELLAFGEELLNAGEQAVLIVEQAAFAKITSYYLTLE